MEQNSQEIKNERPEDTIPNGSETVVVETPRKNGSDDTAYDGMITIDENGMRWCTVKYAAEYLGKSSTTIRRYAQEKRFRHKQEQSPNNYGYTYLISVDDLELLKKLLDSNEKKSSVSHADTAFELLSQLNSLDLPSISDLKEKMEFLQDGQIAVGDVLSKLALQNEEFKSAQDTAGETLSNIVSQNREILQHIRSENESLAEQIKALTAENKKLMEQVKELTITVDRQKAVINELQSRGFFARIANKPPVTFLEDNSGNSGLLTDSEDR